MSNEKDTELAELVARLKTLSTEIAADREAVKNLDDDLISQLLYASARLYSAKNDQVENLEWPITEDALNATETVVLVNALLDAADINLFDMAIWYRRAV